MKRIVFLLASLTISKAIACADIHLASVNTTKAFSEKMSSYCELVNTTDDLVAKVKCENANYRISLANNKIFALIFSQQKRNMIHQCYYNGKISSSCEATLSDYRCDTIELD